MAINDNNLRGRLEAKTGRQFSRPPVNGISNRARVANAASHDNFHNFLFMLDPYTEQLKGEVGNSAAGLNKPRFSQNLLQNVTEMTRARTSSSAA